MPSPETELELAARRLQGQTLERVHYLDAWPGRERAAPTDRDEVGLAVVLGCAGGRFTEVRWADELGLHHGFGIALRELAAPDGDRGKLVDATARWGDRIGRQIAHATITWGDTRADLRGGFSIGIAIHSDYLRRADYPRALVLVLDDGRTITLETPMTNALFVAFTG